MEGFAAEGATYCRKLLPLSIQGVGGGEHEKCPPPAAPCSMARNCNFVFGSRHVLLSSPEEHVDGAAMCESLGQTLAGSLAGSMKQCMWTKNIGGGKEVCNICSCGYLDAMHARLSTTDVGIDHIAELASKDMRTTGTQTLESSFAMSQQFSAQLLGSGSPRSDSKE